MALQYDACGGEGQDEEQHQFRLPVQLDLSHASS
jgi:hypothetical protein